MVKISKRREKQMSDQVVNESSSNERDDLIGTNAASNINASGATGNMEVIDDDDDNDNDNEEQENIRESNVWKYATKVGAEKARCNICQTGKDSIKINL